MSRKRETTTIRAMIGIYCDDHHQTHGTLCVDCEALFEYAQARLGKCPFGDDKPVCADCTIHCYKPAMRERVRQVMRYAGPRMMLRHPVLAAAHLLQKHTSAPSPTPKDRAHTASPATDMREEPDVGNRGEGASTVV
ncbi:MAG: nitrous oxide-stimulated promoter family protein [Pirellulaceae bacterium]